MNHSVFKFTYVLFNKPCGVLSQFSGAPGESTLSNFQFPKGIYPAGRLDKNSEGLLLLTNDGPFVNRLLDPKYGHQRKYWVQVEGRPSPMDLALMEAGVMIKKYKTRPCRAELLEHEPKNLWERNPPIRFRKTVPTSWLEIELSEGKNRQVRRMTAMIGYPTLRLIRVQIAQLKLGDLAPGDWIEISKPKID